MGLNEKFFKSAAGGVVAADNFNTVLYTGNAGASNTTSQSITSVGFQPDLVWVKNRDNANNHVLFDSIKGATNWLNSNNNFNEYSNSTTAGASFLSNGFTTGTSDQTNKSSNNLVSWSWKAGGAAVNGSGTNVTSVKVSANQDAGFSIVKYNYQSSSAATISHGLNEAPEMVIVKPYNSTLGSTWFVYHSSLCAGKEMYLNNNSANGSDSNRWNNTAPTASVFSIGTSFGSYPSYYHGDHIAYCFHSVDNYQKVGSYTGAGSAGLTVTTGFRPRWVMIKRTDSANDWVIIDSIRDTSDPYSKILWADLSDTEADGGSTSALSFSDTGFSMSTSSVGSSINASGGNYIYLAIA